MNTLSDLHASKIEGKTIFGLLNGKINKLSSAMQPIRFITCNFIVNELSTFLIICDLVCPSDH